MWTRFTVKEVLSKNWKEKNLIDYLALYLYSFVTFLFCFSFFDSSHKVLKVYDRGNPIYSKYFFIFLRAQMSQFKYNKRNPVGCNIGGKCASLIKEKNSNYIINHCFDNHLLFEKLEIHFQEGMQRVLSASLFERT